MAQIPTLSNFNNINLQELITLVKNNISSLINVANLGKIITFYPESKTADIELLHYRQFENEIMSMPPLLKVPVVLLSNPNGHITCGDPTGAICVLLTIDRSIENFLITGEKSLAATAAMHSLSDCIAIPCIYSLANNGCPYNNNGLEFLYDKTVTTDDGTTYYRTVQTSTGDEHKLEVWKGSALDSLTSQNLFTLSADGNATLNANNQIDFVGNNQFTAGTPKAVIKIIDDKIYIGRPGLPGNQNSVGFILVQFMQSVAQSLPNAASWFNTLASRLAAIMPNEEVPQ